MKKICWTVITGSYDDLKEPIKPNPSWDFVCFTNQDLKSDTWNIVRIEGENNRKLSRKYKIPNLFPEYDISVFCDATFQLRKNLDIFALNKKEGIWLKRHPQRQCAYEEAEIVALKNLDKSEVIDKHILRYRAEGFPEQYGLWRCGIMVRNPKDEKITELCETWWKEVEAGTWRDQISFPYACWKTGLKPRSILPGITEQYFTQHLHKTHITDEWRSVGEVDMSLKDKHPLAHLIVTEKGILYPRWLGLYIPSSTPKEQFISLVKTLQGTVVHG
jgi:hypothetical protein